MLRNLALLIDFDEVSNFNSYIRIDVSWCIFIFFHSKKGKTERERERERERKRHMKSKSNEL